jgi:drug/metabolite transporter (DMT)-like permease
MVRYRTGHRRAGARRKTHRANRATIVTLLSLLFIVISLMSFVWAQLILKRAMQFSNNLGDVRFVSRLIAGIGLMTISFFLTLGLLQRFDLSYLYPFQGLSVIIITVLAAVILNEKLTPQLAIGGVLISVGIVLVSLS